jgi:hypothetical protein
MDHFEILMRALDEKRFATSSIILCDVFEAVVDSAGE